MAPLNVFIVLRTRVLWYWVKEVYGVGLNPLSEGIRRAEQTHALVNLGSA